MLSKLVLVSLIVSSQCYASKVATIKTQRNVEVNINRVVYNNSIDSTAINQVRKSTAVNRGTELNSRMAIREVDSSEKVVVIENREVDLASYKYLEVFAKSREDSRVKVGVLTKDDSIFYETVDLKFEKTFRWFQVPLEFLKQKVIQSGKSLSSIKSFLIASTEESVDSSKIDAISVKSVHLVNKGRAVESKYKILSVNDSEGSKVSEPDGTFVANIQNISDDSVSPNITNLMLNDRVVISGDYIDAQTTVSFLSNDVDSGLATWNVSFLLDSVLVDEISGNSEGVTENSISAVFTAPLSSGQYSLNISVLDRNGNSKKIVIDNLQVNGELKIDNLICGPNPYNPFESELDIQYQLSKDSDIEIYLYSINGEKQWQFSVQSGDVTGGVAGFNTIAWDGLNAWGERVGVGPCIVYIIATSGSETAVKKEKVMVVQ